MSDDQRRSKSRDEDDFGPPLFGDADDSAKSEKLLFDDNTGPLPHWTEPPTGEMPRVLGGSDDTGGGDDSGGDDNSGPGGGDDD